MIEYRTGNALDVDQVIALYRASTLGERRPVDERARMAGMLEHANLLITAWADERLVGIARCLTDWHYATYVADLAVDVAWQRQGIGVELLRRVQRAGAPAKVILLAAPAATGYYPRVGFHPHPSAWVVGADEPLGAPATGEE